MKKILYLLAACCSITSSLLAVTNIYEFKNNTTNQRIVVIGVIHTYGNQETDEFVAPFKRNMASNLIKQIELFKKNNPNNNLKVIIEDDPNPPIYATTQDPVITAFVRNKIGMAYDPRSPWSLYLESYRQIRDQKTQIPFEIIPSYPSEKLLKELQSEKKLLESWNHIDQDNKRQLLKTNKILQEKLKTISLKDAFFKKGLDNDLLQYDHLFGDVAYLQIVLENKNDNIILVVGVSHAKFLENMLPKTNFTVITTTDFSYGTLWQLVIASVFEKTLTENNNAIENKLRAFLSRLSHACHVCFKPKSESQPLSQCSKCKQTYYCSTECQTTDWPRHKKECKKCEIVPLIK